MTRWRIGIFSVYAELADILDATIPLINREESCRLTAYLDSEGVPTLGWGHTAGVKLGDTCTQQQADAWRNDDLLAAAEGLEDKLPWWRTLGVTRASVLLQMAYQLGVGGLLKFKNTLAMAKAGDYAGAAQGMLNSDWAKQTPARAHREAEQMRTGVL